MTIVVFETTHLTITTTSWAATELKGTSGASAYTEVHCLEAPIKATARLQMTMVEFLAMVAESTKVLDLRPWQIKRAPVLADFAEKLR